MPFNSAASWYDLNVRALTGMLHRATCQLWFHCSTTLIFWSNYIIQHHSAACRQEDVEICKSIVSRRSSLAEVLKDEFLNTFRSAAHIFALLQNEPATDGVDSMLKTVERASYCAASRFERRTSGELNSQDKVAYSVPGCGWLTGRQTSSGDRSRTWPRQFIGLELSAAGNCLMSLGGRRQRA